MKVTEFSPGTYLIEPPKPAPQPLDVQLIQEVVEKLHKEFRNDPLTVPHREDVQFLECRYSLDQNVPMGVRVSNLTFTLGNDSHKFTFLLEVPHDATRTYLHAKGAVIDLPNWRMRSDIEGLIAEYAEGIGRVKRVTAFVRGTRLEFTREMEMLGPVFLYTAERIDRILAEMFLTNSIRFILEMGKDEKSESTTP